MSARHFHWLDVFTDQAFTGNPLAVFPDAGGMTAAVMAAVARELNLSETTFVSPPEQAGTTHRVRIFTPTRELTFAGHPTIGTAICLAALAGDDDETELTLGLGAGPTPVRVVRNADGTRHATLVAPQLPKLAPSPVEASTAAALIGLDPDDVDPSLPVHVADAGGTTFVVVGVRTLDRLAAAHPSGRADGVVGIYAVCRTELGWRTRMFAPAAGVPEDPATGSAAVSFAASLFAHEPSRATEGEHRIVIHQGVEMGRSSQLDLAYDVVDGAIAEVRLAGSAVHVLTGTIG